MNNDSNELNVSASQIGASTVPVRWGLRVVAALLSLAFSASALANGAIVMNDTGDTDDINEESLGTYVVSITQSGNAPDGVFKVFFSTHTGHAVKDLDWEVDGVQGKNNQLTCNFSEELTEGNLGTGEWFQNASYVSFFWPNNCKDMQITVKAKDDALDEGNLEKFQAQINSNSLTQADKDDDISIGESTTKVISISDTDDAQITVTHNGIVTTESGTADSFTVTGSTRPFVMTNGNTVVGDATVSVSVSIGDVPGESTANRPQNTLGTATVVLDKNNYASGVPVSVTTGGGTRYDPLGSFRITFGNASSADSEYDGLAASGYSGISGGVLDGSDTNDDDIGELSIIAIPAKADREHDEGDSFTAAIQRICQSNMCADALADGSTPPVTVNWKIDVSGHDAEEADFTNGASFFDGSKAITFSGTSGESKVTDSITIFDDVLDEPEQNFFVTFIQTPVDTDPDAYRVGTLTQEYFIKASDTDINSQGTITILDDFSPGGDGLHVSVTEGQPMATLRLQRSGAGANAGKVTFEWDTDDIGNADDATAGADYTASSGEISWAAGLAGNSIQTLTVPITQDSDAVDDTTEYLHEFFKVTFDLITNAEDSGKTDASVPDDFVIDNPPGKIRIVDDGDGGDPDRGTISVADTSVIEGNPGDDRELEWSVCRNTGSNGDLEITWAVAADDAEGGDFTTTGAVLTTSWDDTETGCKPVTVPIIEDTDIEDTDDDHVRITLDSVTVDPAEECPGDETDEAWCGVAAPGNDDVIYDDDQGYAEGEIIDDDAPGDIEILSVSPNPVNETQGNIEVILHRVGGNQGNIAVSYETAEDLDPPVDGGNPTDEAATDPEDYTHQEGILLWESGVLPLTKTINIPIINNADDEKDFKKFRLLLEKVAGTLEDDDIAEDLFNNGDVTVTPATTELTIIDDEGNAPSIGTISVPSSATVNEGGKAMVTVTRVGITGDSWVDYTLTDSSELGFEPESGDYNDTPSGTIKFAGSDTSKTIEVQTNNDAPADQDDEKFIITLVKAGSNADNYNFGNKTTTVRIIDKDKATPGSIIVKSVESPVEGTPAGPGNYAVITLERVNGTSGAVNVKGLTQDNGAQTVTTFDDEFDVAVSCDADAVNHDDYIRVTDDTIADFLDNAKAFWDDGEGGERQLMYKTVPDACIESGESFYVNLTKDNGDVSMPQAQVEVPITDDDGGGTFTVVDQFVFEGTQFAMVEVTRTDGTQGFVTLNYFSSSADGATATEGADYEPVSGQLFWSPGDASSRFIPVPIYTDHIEEVPPEWFRMWLTKDGSDRPIRPLDLENSGGSAPSADGIYGTVTILDAVPIPTLNQWMLILLALLLAGMGVRSLQARRP